MTGAPKCPAPWHSLAAGRVQPDFDTYIAMVDEAIRTGVQVPAIGYDPDEKLPKGAII
jgi:hypothetical protein